MTPSFVPACRPSRHPRTDLPAAWRGALVVLVCTAVLVGCGGGDTRAAIGSASGGSTPVAGSSQAAEGTGEASGNGAYSLRASNRSVTVVEGDGEVTVSLALTREAGHSLPVTLAAAGVSAADEADLSWRFSDDRLEAGETTTELTVALGIGVAPRLPGTRTLRVIATDGSNSPVASELTLQIQPTVRQDVYLLAGQSNMVGYSKLGSRAAGAGEPDAPNPRIFELNVTGNDNGNFADPADFTDPARIAAADPAFTLALDPLHDGYDVNTGGKSVDLIGPGLSFAKAALASTTAEIVLVPSAWSDTGFCKRGTNRFAGLGWLADPRSESVFSGTLLHDRAIARVNLALEQTGGILRGILWHQGEADSDNAICAAEYEANLRALVASLRTNIIADARGPAARGPAAEVPFVLGTMSQGVDERGDMLPFPANKLIVDGVHRNIANVVPYSDVVVNDDFRTGYECGEGSCIHFGARAYREMGARYFERLQELTSGR